MARCVALCLFAALTLVPACTTVSAVVVRISVADVFLSDSTHLRSGLKRLRLAKRILCGSAAWLATDSNMSRTGEPLVK